MLINKSFASGIFPDCLKLARITPLYKSGDREDFTNYRPVSILDIISKIYEKAFYCRLEDFLNSNEILTDVQFGFRRGFSTSQAIQKLLGEVYRDLDDNNLVFSMFLDFKKAFDCVSHPILLSKLYHYGIRGVVHGWVNSYLTDRKQCTMIDGVRSS